ncbi:hypothetical protein [Kordiimonas sp.]|uniref:hypothetical protein n=1 Tax=Kordiimonas sp. TaxID=1970157 RepID=UPI003A9048A0
MPSTYEVTAVRKCESRNAFEIVTHLCGEAYDGSQWQIPLEDAIEGLRCGRFEFLVPIQEGRQGKLVIARSPYNRYYLKCTEDRGEPTSLLRLPMPQPD